MATNAGLRQVGEFPVPMNQRRLVRTVKSPMDRATVVSILPKRVKETKVTIEPGQFEIPPGTPDDPQCLVVGPSSWWRDIDIEQPIIEIPVSSVQIADSIVRDYCVGMLGCNMGDAKPGLFFVLGSVTPVEVKVKYREALAEAVTKQNRWFNILVRLADSLWARSNNNPLVIADEMRMGARMLGFNDKPWLKDFQAVELVNCAACGSRRDPAYPVCPACKYIDPNHPLSKDLKFAV